VFTIDRWEEWIALFIFLLTAIAISQLTVVLRERTALARRRERETKILFELIRLANSSELFVEQLGIVVESIVRVFAVWGVNDCAMFLSGPDETLTLAAQATIDSHEVVLSQEEQAMAVSALTQGEMMEKRTAPFPDSRDSVSHITHYSTIGPVTILRFIPLKTADRVLGVLALHIQHPVPWFSTIERMQQEQARSNSRIEFFWTFLEQATSIVERARLRSSVSSSND
jgi:two-component system sensor histidine kinase KdpD